MLFYIIIGVVVLVFSSSSWHLNHFRKNKQTRMMETNSRKRLLGKLQNIEKLGW